MITLGLALLAALLCVIAWSFPGRRDSRFLAIAVALALLAGTVWSAYRDNKWWMLLAGLFAGALWIALDEWRERRRPRQAP